ncbi:hypothetical protein V8G54_007373 [Vigna mungo]|uniref:Uncharacterized protein n=1 Tax=Vigna mungo TaxID=3915 RepID=A0AAQ3P0X5_VIGMU
MSVAMNPLPFTAKVAVLYVVKFTVRLRLPEITVSSMPSPIITMFHFLFVISTVSVYKPFFMCITKRLMLYSGAAFTASITVVKLQLPSAATTASGGIVLLCSSGSTNAGTSSIMKEFEPTWFTSFWSNNVASLISSYIRSFTFPPVCSKPSMHVSVFASTPLSHVLKSELRFPVLLCFPWGLSTVEMDQISSSSDNSNNSRHATTASERGNSLLTLLNSDLRVEVTFRKTSRTFLTELTNSEGETLRVWIIAKSHEAKKKKMKMKVANGIGTSCFVQKTAIEMNCRRCRTLTLH